MNPNPSPSQKNEFILPTMEGSRSRKHPVVFTFVRHGETESNASQIIQGSTKTHLNEKGRSQAHATGSRLRAEGVEIDFFFASSNPRAVETAEIIKKQLENDSKRYALNNFLLLSTSPPQVTFNSSD